MLPETIEASEPLYAAVVHGCRAGRQKDAMVEVYWRRIQRGDEFYSSSRLGVFGLDLTALAGFFDRLWDQPSAQLDAAWQSFALGQVAFCLRALGRLAEAIAPMRAALEREIALQAWKNAARVANNLSELTLALGGMRQATAVGNQSVDLADRSGDAYWRVCNRTLPADALHQAGKWHESATAFREAEALLMAA